MYELSCRFRYVAVGEKNRGCWGPNMNEGVQGVQIKDLILPSGGCGHMIPRITGALEACTLHRKF